MSNGGLYIPVYCDLQHHPKMKRLCRILGKITPEDQLLLRAKLENLWIHAVLYWPNGIISSTDEEIASECLWYDDPSTFVNALCDSGFANRIENTGIEIHGWDKYAGKLIIRREKSAEYMRKHREKSTALALREHNVSITSALREHDVSITCENVVLERENENERKENKKDFCVEASKKEAIDAGAILEFPVIQKQKTGKPETWNLTQPLLDEFIHSYPAIDALTQCKAAHAWIIANPKNRKTFSGMSRFLNGWLSRAQNSAPRIETQTQPDSPEDKKRKLRDQYDAELSERIRKLNGGFDNPQAFINSCESRMPIHHLPEKSLQSLPHWNQYREILQANSIPTMPIKPPEIPRSTNVEDAKSLD